jgi:hypothetical protein
MALPQDPQTTIALINILRDPACSHINFKWINQPINAAGYQVVADMLADGRIGTVLQPPSNGGLAAYRQGNRDPAGGNTFFISPNFHAMDPVSRIMAVHESTHAIQDFVMDGTTIFMEDVEGAAYFAQSLFNIFSPVKLQLPESRMHRAVYKVCMQAARSFIANPPKNGVLCDDTIDDIVNAIKGDREMMEQEIIPQPIVIEDGVPL